MGQKVLCLGTSLKAESNTLKFSKYLAGSFDLALISIELTPTFMLDSFLEKEDVILLVLQLSDKKRLKNQLKNYLALCRELRLPYIFIKEWESPTPEIDSIYAPVGYLVEEKEKGKWTGSFHKFMKTRITFVQPKDRGTRAARNLKFITDLLDKRETPYNIIKGVKPTGKGPKEALQIILNQNDKNAMLMLSSSRDYGLDDIVFGPREFHVVKKATMPVMLINPRDDIYMLCGD